MAMDLSDYLQNEAKKRHAKKSDIAFRTGISESYIYKIFTGTKHTKQRDYVIAICHDMHQLAVWCTQDEQYSGRTEIQRTESEV